MKAAGIVIALAIASALVYWFVLRGHPAATPTTQTTTAAGSSSSAPPTPSPTKAKAVDKVRRVTKEERAALAQQIQAARRSRDNDDGQGLSKHTETPRPTLQQQDDDVAVVKTTMKAAMHEVIPMLTECYSKGGSNLPTMMDVVANLTLTGDPDVGTIVDANSLENKDGTPVNVDFERCVRDTLVTLEMPPLSEGDVVQVTYPFVFAADDGTMPP